MRADQVLEEFRGEFENRIPSRDALEEELNKWYARLEAATECKDYTCEDFCEAVIAEYNHLMNYLEECDYVERTYRGNKSRRDYFNC